MGVRGRLRQYQIRPSRKLGQCFIEAPQMLQREAECAHLRPEDRVLEIGPGIGNLTECLLQRAGRVIAVEQDRQFAPCLAELQGRYDHLELIWGDALSVNFPHFDKAVANLPYSIALPLIFKLLDCDFSRAVLMCQQRLAERICAAPGQKGYCRLSVAIGRRAQVEILELVPRTAFHPQPEVDSALLGLRKIPPKFDIPDEDFFRDVLEHLFGHGQMQVEQAVLAQGAWGAPRKVRRTPMSRTSASRSKPS